ncbi:MAG: hypothetical protein FWH27_00155 [Planctomycetaceae bacterium]|nr:hypothetical protein [Planctomycetaceae bacterium]
MDIYGKEPEFDFDYPVFGDNKPLYIGMIDLSDPEVMVKLGTKMPRKLFLFGGKAPYPNDPQYTTVNYNVVEHNTTTKQTVSHYLAQFGEESVFWHEEGITTHGKCADMLKKKDCPSLFRHPKWKLDGMAWPTYQDQMFFFAQQIHVPENKFTSDTLSCHTTLYVFVLLAENDRLLVQLIGQDTSAQTAEQHYKLEQAMIDYEQNCDNPEIIEKLIKTNSKDFHQYLLDDTTITKTTLEFLVEHGKTKRIKDEAKKRL